MKNLKKTLALVLALAMVLAMGSSAFATDLSSGKTGSGGNSAALISGESINIKKELKPVNPENSTINAPTITYTYAVSAGAARFLRRRGRSASHRPVLRAFDPAGVELL